MVLTLKYVALVHESLAQKAFESAFSGIGPLAAFPLDIQVETLRPARAASASRIAQCIGPELVHIHANAAVAVSSFRGKGKAYKKLIDALATDVHHRGLKTLARFVPGLDLRVVQGEGAKDQSAGLFTGQRYCNDLILAGHQALKIDLNIDPVDGTTPTAVLDVEGRLAPLGTSITSYGLRPPGDTALLRVPDTASIFLLATPLDLPTPGLNMCRGRSFEDMVILNVRGVARARLRQRLGRRPHRDELAAYIASELRVCMMNRSFQNLAIVRALKKAGMHIDFRPRADGKDIDFSDWETSAVYSENKNHRRANLCLVGDGNVAGLLMEGVDLFIGNSGSVEAVQMATLASDIQGVFFSKDLRKKRPIADLIDTVRQVHAAPLAEKQNAFNACFPSETEQKDFAAVHMDAAQVMGILGHKDFIRSSDFFTVISAITPLQGTGIFAVPDAPGVLLDLENAQATVVSFTASSSGEICRVTARYRLPVLLEANQWLADLMATAAEPLRQKPQWILENAQQVTQVVLGLWRLGLTRSAKTLLDAVCMHKHPDAEHLVLPMHLTAKFDALAPALDHSIMAQDALAQGNPELARQHLSWLLEHWHSPMFDPAMRRLLGALYDDVEKLVKKTGAV